MRRGDSVPGKVSGDQFDASPTTQDRSGRRAASSSTSHQVEAQNAASASSRSA